MRGTFIKNLTELAADDPRIMLLTADLGYMVIEQFAEQFPDRFINVGVAEQNMVGVATGLAEAGFIPFVYSIATFASLRPYEFIRNGPVLHDLPVRIVAIGGGFEYGHAGVTHHALEDVAVMRAQPGLTVIAPADYPQTETALRQTWDAHGPIYYRLGKDDKNVLPGLTGAFAMDRVQRVTEGDDLLILTMGSVAFEAVAAAEALRDEGINCTVAVVPVLNPTPSADLLALLSGFSTAITVEAHYMSGGLGSMVSEVVASSACACRVVRRAVEKTSGGAGNTAHMRNVNGISAAALAETARQVLQP